MPILSGNKTLLAILSFLIGKSAWSCATCGQNSAFTPATLLISFGFFLLPMAMVCWIGWVIYKDSATRLSTPTEKKNSNDNNE